MESFELLGSLATRLHQELRGTFYLFLPLFFGISLIVAWFRNPAGGPDFLESLKRTVVATLLLVGFQEISDAILSLTNGLTSRIGDMSGLDAVLQMAGEKTKGYTLSTSSVILGFNDLLVASLSFLSYLCLYVARYLMVALYHFSWVLLVLIAPIVLLFHLFSPKMSLNLFRSLLEVASWNVVWAILSAMLMALPFGNAYAADGNYLTVIVLNFVISLALIGTPLVVRSLVGSGLAAMTASLGPAVVTAMALAPAKTVSVLQFGRQVLEDTRGYARHQASRFTRRNPQAVDLGRQVINKRAWLPPPPKKG